MKIKNRFNLFRLPQLALVLTSATAMGGEEMKAPAPAPISTPDWLKVSGYAAASYTYTDVQHGDSDESLFDAGTPLDAVKLGLEATQGNFSGYASLFYSPNTDANSFAGGSEAGILDAYVSYTAGAFKITGGKYLSYLGYEAFDTVNMTQLTYANSTTGGVPAYHTGVKVDYVTGNHGLGAAVVDSIYGSTLFNGDGSYTSKGLEAYYTYKGIKDTQIWLGGLQDNDNGGAVYDLWVSYALNKTDSLGAEYLVKESDGYNWLLAYTKGIDSKLSVTARLSGESSDVADAKFVKYTLSPSYAFTDKFTVRAEVSYTDYSGAGASTSNSTFYAIQSLFKF